MRLFTEQVIQDYARSHEDAKVVLQEWAVKRVEELLPLVTDSTPLNDTNSKLNILGRLIK